MTIDTEPFIRKRRGKNNNNSAGDGTSNYHSDYHTEVSDVHMDPQDVQRRKIIAKDITNTMPIGEGEDGEKIYADVAKEGDEEVSPGARTDAYNPETAVHALAQVDSTLQEGWENPTIDTTFYDEETGQTREQTGGRSNRTTLARYLSGNWMQDLLNNRAPGLSDEVRYTDWDVGFGPEDPTDPEFNLQGSAVNRRSYGVPLPDRLIPPEVGALRKDTTVKDEAGREVRIDKEGNVIPYADKARYAKGSPIYNEYSKGYQQSFALALLMGLLGHGGRENSVDNPNIFNEYVDAIKAIRTPDPQSKMDGTGLFNEGVNALFGPQTEDMYNRFATPVRRARAFTTLLNRMNAGGEDADQFVQIMDALRGHSANYRKGYARGDDKARQAAEDKITQILDAVPDKYLVKIDENNIGPLLDLILTGKYTIPSGAKGAKPVEYNIGPSIRNMVTSDLLSSEEGSPVSVEDLGKTRANYDYIRDIIRNKDVQRQYLPGYLGMIADQMESRNAQANSGFVGSAVNKLRQIRDNLTAGGELTPEDDLFLRRWGLNMTPRRLFTYLTGSGEKANVANDKLGLFKKVADQSVLDYLMPRDEYIQTYYPDIDATDREVIADLPNPIRSQRGYYLRNAIDNLADDLRGIIDSEDGPAMISRLYGTGVNSPVDRMLYTFHRFPKDYLKEGAGKKRLDPSTEEYEKAVRRMLSDRATKNDTTHWAWSEGDVQNAIEDVIENGTPSPKSLETLRKMGYIRDGTLIPKPSENYARKLLENAGFSTEGRDLGLADVGFVKAMDLTDVDMPDKDKAVLSDAMGVLRENLQSGTLDGDGVGEALSKIEELHDKYVGEGNYSEIGMKRYDGEKISVDDLGQNFGDVYRYINPNSESMDRASTYLGGLKNYDEYKELLGESRDLKNEIWGLEHPSRMDREMDDDSRQQFAREREQALKDAKYRAETIGKRMKKIRDDLIYPNEAKIKDVNSVLDPSDQETLDQLSAKGREMDEARMSEDEVREENDQFAETKDVAEDLFYDMNRVDEETVLKNILSRLASSTDITNPTATFSTEDGIAIPRDLMQMIAAAKKYYEGGDTNALRPGNIFSEDELQDIIGLEGLGLRGDTTSGGTPPEQIVNGLLEGYYEPNDKDIDTLINAVLREGSFIPDDVRKDIEDVYEAYLNERAEKEYNKPKLDTSKNTRQLVQEKHDKQINGTLSQRFTPAILGLRDYLYDLVNGPGAQAPNPDMIYRPKRVVYESGYSKPMRLDEAIQAIFHGLDSEDEVLDLERFNSKVSPIDRQIGSSMPKIHQGLDTRPPGMEKGEFDKINSKAGQLVDESPYLLDIPIKRKKTIEGGKRSIPLQLLRMYDQGKIDLPTLNKWLVEMPNSDDYLDLLSQIGTLDKIPDLDQQTRYYTARGVEDPAAVAEAERTKAIESRRKQAQDLLKHWVMRMLNAAPNLTREQYTSLYKSMTGPKYDPSARIFRVKRA